MSPINSDGMTAVTHPDTTMADAPPNDETTSAGPKKNSKWNYNVKVMLWLIGLIGAADSIWSGTVMAALVFMVSGGSNAVVGYVEAAYGLTILLSAYPVGYAADKYTRSGVIRIGGVVCILAAIATSFAGYYAAEEEIDSVTGEHKQKDWPIWMIGGCMALWGISSGIGSGPAQALYADSIPVGDRSTWYMYLMVIYLIASIIGPVIAIAIFQVYGDNWRPKELRNVLWAGMVVELMIAVPMFLFDDSKALTQKGDEEDTDKEDEKGDKDDTKHSGVVTTTSLGIKKKHIPWILFANDIVVAVGSGMTVKYFPLFFKSKCHYSPSQVQGIYIATPISIAIFSKISTMISKKIGRIPSIMLLRFIGVGFLLGMTFGQDDLKPIILVILYVIRTGLMNATYPLEESILMDSVPKKTRARWKSLESISQFGWCGSAVLGGFLSDHYSYGFTFIITAALQGAGSLLLLLIHPLVPHESNNKEGKTASANVYEDQRALIYEDEKTENS